LNKKKLPDFENKNLPDDPDSPDRHCGGGNKGTRHEDDGIRDRDKEPDEDFYWEEESQNDVNEMTITHTFLGR
jgi:hypothetical protein